MSPINKFNCLMGLFVVCSLNSLSADDNLRTIRVTGEGTSAAAPDMATIHTGVVTQAPLAVDAMEENNQIVDKMMADLKDMMIAERDIQSTQFAVQPEYARGPRGEQNPEIVGYRVTNQLRVRVRNLPQLGKLLDMLVRSGGNQVSGLSFGVDDTTKVMNEARTNAMADARARADLYAAAAGVSVGQVLSIDEQQIGLPPPMFRGVAMEAAASSVPIATGEQDFSASITVTFEIKNED